MCHHCDNTFSRRDALKATALTLAATTLAACDATPPNELPDAYQEHHILDDFGGGTVTIDHSKIIAPPPLPAQPTDFGDIMPRAAWTRSPLTLRNATPMDGITKITLHHSGDGKPFLATSTADVAKHLQIVEQAHLQRGMIDIAYHFAVDRTGRAWQLRWLQYEGQHVRLSKNGTHNNPHNIGIVALGDFNVQPPSVQQRDRLITLVQLLASKYGLLTPQKKPRPNAVLMHGEIVDTDCPGKSLKPWILDARQKGLI